MTKLKIAITLVGILAVAGCTTDREPSTVRNGPQAENPYADAPGGKMPTTTGDAIPVVVIDDSQANIDRFAAGASTSIVQTVFR